MAVTKQTYTASATWTAAGAATLFEDAFIDAGLMTAWHDSFANGALEHRVLEIEYDGTKTYGTCYYWFIFTTTGIFVSVASGWNTGTNVPSGSQFLDYASTATNTTNNHIRVGPALVASTDLELSRYTASGHSWFSFRNGSVPTPFLITPGSATLPGWLDLDKVLFHHFVQSVTVRTGSTTNSGRAVVGFHSLYSLRRSFMAQGYPRDLTLSTNYGRYFPTMNYGMFGNQTNFAGNAGDLSATSLPTTPSNSNLAVLAPYGFTNTNPEYASDYHPVISGYTYSFYVNTPVPSDFGLAFDFSSTSYSFGDRVIVSAGVEEWEVLQFSNVTATDASTPLLLARVV
jgi:hypothetical protein